MNKTMKKQLDEAIEHMAEGPECEHDWMPYCGSYGDKDNYEHVSVCEKCDATLTIRKGGNDAT